VTSERYDHCKDPNEWKNLSGDKYQEIINDLASFIPKIFAKKAPSKRSYDFDPYSYTWINKKTGKQIRVK
tara:strand:- start:42 stop:251 length:210 start_codon:yes stop_codon:yes gene_type:complete